MSLVNIANAIDSTKVADATLTFNSGTTISPKEDGTCIKYPFWHAAINPFLHDFNEYARYLQHKLDTDSPCVKSLCDAGGCAVEDNKVTKIKFEIVPDTCIFTFMVDSAAEMGKAWMAFVAEWRKQIGQYVLSALPEVQEEFDLKYLSEDPDGDPLPIIYYEVEYNIRFSHMGLFKSKSFEEADDEIIGHINKRGRYVVAARTPYTTKVFETAEDGSVVIAEN